MSELQLWTARFTNPVLAKHPSAKVRISRGQPRMFLPYTIDTTLMRLAPSSRLLSWSRSGLSDEEFDSLFTKQLEKVDLAQLITDLELIVERTQTSGAVLLCYEPPGVACHRRTVAAWYQAHTGQAVPELDELETGEERTITVPEPLPETLPERHPTREETAYHEAGHVVVLRHFGLPINSVTIRASGDFLGAVAHPSPLMLEAASHRERRRVARQMILVSYAGLAAERLVNPRADADLAASDDEDAFELSRQYGVLPRHCSFVGDDLHWEFLGRLRREAERLVRSLRAEVKRTAAELLEAEEPESLLMGREPK